MYYYIKNLQGDIVKVINQAGVTYANYVYDTFGNILEAYGDPIISKLSPFRYRGYVYDIETGLYYLQSRYYDPVTGRFSNADVYCDTQTGTPLSTNMFAYCANNPIINYDENGYWEKLNHATMCKIAGFSKDVVNWVQYADSYFSSGNDKINNKTVYCSAPFHSRTSALEIAKYIYNKAIKVKKSKSKIKFYNSSNKKNKDNVACLYIDYFGYRKTKTDNKLTLDNSKEKKLKDMLNNLSSSKKQSDALIGLTLHILQDYFAHTTPIDVYKHYAGGKTYLKKYKTTTSFSNGYLHNTKIFEDNINVMSWRYTNSQRITYVIYDLYKSNKQIKSIKVVNVSNKKESYTFTHSRTKYTIKAKEYYLTIKY